MSLEKTSMWVRDITKNLRGLFLADPEIGAALLKIAQALPGGRFSLTPQVQGQEFPVIEWIEYKDGVLSAKFWGDDEPSVLTVSK